MKSFAVVLIVLFFLACGSNGTKNQESTQTKVQESSVRKKQEKRISLESLGIQMISIPAGSFNMGSNFEKHSSNPYRNEGIFANERPIHTVTLEVFEVFYMSATEITQMQFQAIMNKNPSKFKGNKNLPVENVSWFDAVKFCNKLSSIFGMEPCYDLNNWECDFTKNGFRLPSEAEWEYACRAGSTTEYNFGNDKSILGEYAWFADNSNKKIHPVGQKKPNEWGLYDMHGNVNEWCNDWESEDYYKNSPAKNPRGVSYGKFRVHRSSNWYNPAIYCRSAARTRYLPNGKNKSLGFRISRNKYSPESLIIDPKKEQPILKKKSGEKTFSALIDKIPFETRYRIIEHTTDKIIFNVFDCDSYKKTSSGLLINPPAKWYWIVKEEGLYNIISKKELSEQEPTQFEGRLRTIQTNPKLKKKPIESSVISEKEVKKIIRQRLDELLTFCKDPEFVEYSFSAGGKYKNWMMKVKNLQNKSKNMPVPIKVAIGDLIQLGLEYVSTKGIENEYTKFTRTSLRDVINEN